MKVSVQTVEEREPKLFNCKVSNSLLYLLYKQGCDHEKQIQQWVRMNNYNLANSYNLQCEAIVELLESLVVFHNGMGYNLDSHSVSERLHSFAYLARNKLPSSDFDWSKTVG